MNTVLRVGVLLLFALAVFGSAWYVAFSLRTTFGLQRRWLLVANWRTVDVDNPCECDWNQSLSAGPRVALRRAWFRSFRNQ